MLVDNRVYVIGGAVDSNTRTASVAVGTIAADHALGVLDSDAALGLSDRDGRSDDHQQKHNHHHHHDGVVFAHAFAGDKVLPCLNQRAGQR